MPTARQLALLGLLLPVRLAGQASPYIPVDDPRLPALEHLIMLGDVEDPTPQVRPFRRADAVRVLEEALTRPDTRDSALIGRLRRAWSEDTAPARWEVEGRVGDQAYTEARRDPLHPAGDGGVQPLVSLRLQAVFGNLAMVSRPAIEPRVTDDPDWPGRRDLDVAGRHAEGYLSAQFRWVRLYYGQMDQNWGPVGLPGIGLSDYGYPRPAFGLAVGNDQIRLSAQATQLGDETDSLGRTVHRYFFAHRLDARITRRLRLGLWETVVLAGPDRSFDARYRNPVTLLLLANQYGLGAEGNLLLGLDLHWRVGRRHTLEAQFALDDFQYRNRSGPTRLPDRYAFTVMATGPLTDRLAWRAAYTQASSLAFRATDPFESFTDQGVGLGRAFSDNDQVTVQVSAPVLRNWIVRPELTLFRQGQGRLSAPFPQGTQRGATPTLFIGTVERTWRAALNLSGTRGPLAVQGDLGLHRVVNAGNVAGRDRTRVVARIQASLGIGRHGTFR